LPRVRPNSPPIEVHTRRLPSRIIACILLLAPLACGSWKRVGVADPNTPPEQLPQLFDPGRIYGEMGLLTDPGPLGVIGTARIVAGPSRDSLLVVIGLSMKNRGLTFHRDADQFVAEYRVETTFRQNGTLAQHSERDERIRVASFRETQRSDESIIFQQNVVLAPGDYTMGIAIRDRNGTSNARLETPVTVPALQATAVSLPIPVYQATPRTSLASPPSIVMNPRMSVSYGIDTMRFYVETYNISAGTSLLLTAVDGTGRAAWQDTLRITDQVPVRGFEVLLPPQRLSIGRYELRLSQGSAVMAATPFLVSFSDQYAAANLQDIVSLLRWFAPADSLRLLLTAAPEDRAAAWQRFWHNSDPNPATPENEAIDEYLRRVQIANERFRDEGMPGWLTERGEVYIALGEPTDILDRRPDTQGRNRWIQWTYYGLNNLTLSFFDDTGFGRYRMDPRSRNDFMRVSNRIHR
jgi:GWxTD domain-containing protein